MAIFKNISLIKRSLLKTVIPGVIIFSTIAIGIGRVDAALSAVLGATFSFLSLQNMMVSQSYILKHQQKKAFFIPFINRLILNAVPIGLGLWLKDYLNLWIILIFLLSFQVSLVTLELKKNLNQVKKRQKNWTESDK